MIFNGDRYKLHFQDTAWWPCVSLNMCSGVTVENSKKVYLMSRVHNIYIGESVYLSVQTPWVKFTKVHLSSNHHLHWKQRTVDWCWFILMRAKPLFSQRAELLLYPGCLVNAFQVT